MTISKEIFGITEDDATCNCLVECDGCKAGFINAIKLIDQYELSEEELAKIISEECYEEYPKGCYSNAARVIIQNKSKIFVRKTK
tara:strand:+ start:4225 stop:4479 length:255 start_codon:yes stop_codon:yes gene_type:complete